MLYFSTKEIIDKAIEISQLGALNIPYNSVIMMLDNEYRNLQNDLVRSGRNGIQRTAVLTQIEDSVPLNWKQYLLPPDCNRILKMYRVGPIGNRTEEILENNLPSPTTYVQNQSIIMTESAAPIYIDYAPVLHTPTYTAEPTSAKGAVAYDAARNVTYYLNDGVITDSNGEVYDADIYSKVIARDRRVIALGADGYYDLINDVQTPGVFDDIDYDAATDTIWTLSGTVWTDGTITSSWPIMTWGNGTIYFDGSNIYIDDVIIEDNVTGPVLFNKEYVLANVSPGKQIVLPLNGEAWILNYDVVTAFDPSEITGLGCIGTIKGENVIGGWTPTTSLEFFLTIYFDILIYRMALNFMSYAGAPNQGISILLGKMEEVAFKQNRRSHTPRRVKNMRTK